MSILKRSFAALVASALVAAPASAQMFQFNVTSCFYTGSSACSVFGDPSVYSFNSNKSSITFNPTNTVSGNPNPSGSFANFVLGQFTFSNSGESNGSTQTLPTDLKLRLRVDFSSPAGTSPDPTIFGYADVDGTLLAQSGTDAGSVQWTFTGTNVSYFNYTGGIFAFTLNDGNTFSGNDYDTSADVTGSIQCVTQNNGQGNYNYYGGGGEGGPSYSNAACAPQTSTDVTTVTPEPGTYALMTAGLLGLGMVARRRRQNA